MSTYNDEKILGILKWQWVCISIKKPIKKLYFHAPYSIRTIQKYYSYLSFTKYISHYVNVPLIIGLFFISISSDSPVSSHLIINFSNSLWIRRARRLHLSELYSVSNEATWPTQNIIIFKSYLSNQSISDLICRQTVEHMCSVCDIHWESMYLS